MSDDETEAVNDLREKLRATALRYTAMGLSVIPIGLSSKTPAVPWTTFQDRIADDDEVNEWFDIGVPDGRGGLTTLFGLGIVTGAISNIVVVDCDNQDALTYALTQAGYFSLVSVATTRGRHLYFKHPGYAVQNKVGGSANDWPQCFGLDLRGDGGYVVAPPTVKFDSDGKFAHQYTWNFPDEELENFIYGMPTWHQPKTSSVEKYVDGEEWSFDNLRLSAIRSYGETVWTELDALVKKYGRKLRSGDGRNNWVTRYAGECISSGMDEQQTEQASIQFEDAFFSEPLSEKELQTIIRSVVNTDRKNHPEKYEAQEKYENKTEKRQKVAKALKLITPSNLADLHKMVGGRNYLVDPFIPPGSIIQVVGFSGHGKSLIMFYLSWAASKGLSFGPAYVDKPVRTLYCDLEGSGETLSERALACEDMFGPMNDNLTIFSSACSGEQMLLSESESLDSLAQYISDIKPQVVIIDTVRQAWLGMDENSPHSWVKVNNAAMAIRNAGMTAILVHHRNKPSIMGHGREAGSTAQLKDVDAQIIITKVVEDLEQAKREAAAPDEATSVTDFSGATTTSWKYLKRAAKPGSTLRMVFEVSFGKLRQSSENHVTSYIGLGQDNATGAWFVVSTLTPRQKALVLHRKGLQADDICQKLQIPQKTIMRWTEKAGQHGENE